MLSVSLYPTVSATYEYVVSLSVAPVAQALTPFLSSLFVFVDYASGDISYYCILSFSILSSTAVKYSSLILVNFSTRGYKLSIARISGTDALKIADLFRSIDKISLKIGSKRLSSSGRYGSSIILYTT